MVQDEYIEDQWKFSVELSNEQREEMKAILRKFDMWDRIGLLKTGETMSMPLKPEFEGKPCHSAPYPISRWKQSLMDPFLDALEKDGVIEDSKATDFSSPCLIVIQKGRPRFVVDYRKVNARCIPDPYPLPRQEQVMNAVEGSAYISLFDIQKAFFQLPIELRDRHKTTFVTPHRGAKQFTRALMGYLGSPAFCQRQIDRILSPWKWEFTVCYVDDIVIFSKDWESHLRHVETVLKALYEAGLTLDSKKAYIGFKSLKLLGHLVSRFGLSVQEEKIKAMMELPEPKTLGDLDKTLGFFGYYRSFVENYSQIAAPLTDMLTGVNRSSTSHQKDLIEWNDTARKAFAKLKECLANACTRSHAKWNPSCEYALYVDASHLGFGGALHIIEESGIHGPNGKRSNKSKEYPVVFISRSLKKNEKQYWPTELELAGLVWALSKLEHLVEGHSLKIYTDHVALTWLFNVTTTKTKFNQRLLLWALALQKWRPSTTIVHRPGRSHVNADVLSRYPVASTFPKDLRKDTSSFPQPDPHRRSAKINSITLVELSNAFKRDLAKSYDSDKHLKEIYKKICSSSENHYHAFRVDSDSKLMYFRNIAHPAKPWRLVIPDKMLKELFHYAHDNFGHQGFEKSYDRLAGVYVPRLSRKLKSYIQSCPNCLASKSKRTTDGLLNPIATPDTCFHTITMDFVSGLPVSPKGFDSVLTITDKFTKVVTLVAVKTTDDAERTAQRFYRKFYLRYGLPKAIISDRDTRFVSQFWKSLARRLDTRLLMSTAYHPQTDGLSERTNQTMENILRSMIGYGVDEDWASRLKEVEFCINTAKHSTTNASPYEVLYGMRPHLLGDLMAVPEDAFEKEDWIKGREILRKEVSDAISDAATVMARHYDNTKADKSFTVGDYVLIKNRKALKIPGIGSNKISSRFFGPFKIVKRIGSTAYKLELPPGYRMHDTINVQDLKLAPQDEYHRAVPPPPPDAIDEEWADYEVESVIDKRKRRGSWQYLVKFKGYPLSDSIWYDESQSDSFAGLRDDYNLRLGQGLIENTMSPRRLRRSLTKRVRD